MHHEVNSQTEGQERTPEEPCRLNHPRAPDHETGRLGRAQAAEHHYDILADRDILAESHAAEEVDQIMANRGIVARRHVAEEVHYVMIGLAIDAHVAEKDDNVPIHRALYIHAAKEANRVMNGVLLGDIDGAAELNDILRCQRGLRSYIDAPK